MKKLKASKKDMRDHYYILGVGYCSLQYLLKYEDPLAYSVGVYGWACDYYDIEGVIISTGYQPLSSKNTVKDYNLIKEYDDKARELVNDCTYNYNTRKRLVTELLSEFISKVKRKEE